MDAIAPGHIIVVAIVAAVLFFGWKQLPDMSRSLGRSMRIFKSEMKVMADDDSQHAPAGPSTPEPVLHQPQPDSAATVR